jgi:hypothetical protein
MKKTSLYYFVLVLLALSCNTPKQIVDHRQQAESFYAEGDYDKAIAELNKYLDEQKINETNADPKVYNDLAKLYLMTNNFSQAERYYDWAMTKNAVTEDLVAEMSNYYNEIDNLSREITALEYYRDRFPAGQDIVEIRKNLFNAYMKSENWHAALEIWPVLDEEIKNTENYTQHYFKLNKEIENNELCDELAEKLLAFNENNQEALEWTAKKYYYLGENRYQAAMKAYNKKKTTRNYNILLKELDLATVDFKKSLKYFNQLWEKEDGKQFAVYLANIYSRFDDKAKSQYYKSFID